MTTKENSVFKKRIFWRRILLLFVSLILGVNIYVWNARSLVGNRLPMPFGYGAAVVLSGSMEPILSVDDLVIIKKTAHIKVGDIIVYQSENELIIHRIIKLNGDTVITQGDANNAADSPVSMDDVKGKMICHFPAIGMVVRMLKTPAGVLVILVLSMILMEVSYQREHEEDGKDLEKLKEEIRKLKAEQELNKNK